MPACFVREPGLPPARLEPHEWTEDRFVAVLRAAGVHNAGVAPNGQRWFAEVQDAARVGACTIEGYIAVRGRCEAARFCHATALQMAITKA